MFPFGDNKKTATKPPRPPSNLEETLLGLFDDGDDLAVRSAAPPIPVVAQLTDLTWFSMTAMTLA